MPRTVQNFWINANVDGKQTAVSTGTRDAEGGFTLGIKQREDGDVTDSLTVVGRVRATGNYSSDLVLHVYNSQGDLVYEVVTER